ncbi:hypothetical protein [Roseisolibacter sp. H3M3-2]|uniref:hypothetical protein n=1 Tax=Roseisolibacter sp. H3M3-2 TaxID=3031323 RepID=UPI0023DCA0EC|nr:hypothetical protein [Roseisolibacter sp. H3M3-2]MDF1506308.1 hypothetical protein [Roseisolibacter sp. H3M3-2]
MTTRNPADYLNLQLTDDDGRLIGGMNVHHERLAEKITDFLGQHRAGEIVVRGFPSLSTSVWVDP